MKDTNGREYAKLEELKPGDKVEVDDGFTCMKEGDIKAVCSAPDGLFINCDEGKHYLEGQVYDEADDSLVGVYKVQP